MRKLLLLLLLTASIATAETHIGGRFYKSHSVQNHLEYSKHVANDPRGSCVFVSLTHAAYLQKVEAAYDLWDWIRGEEVLGSSPEDLPEQLDSYMRDTGGKFNYFSKQGASLEYLEYLLRVGNFPVVTYSGNDRHDGGIYAQSILHAVCVVHIDEEYVAFIDPNLPKYYTWVDRKSFEERWFTKRFDTWVIWLTRR